MSADSPSAGPDPRGGATLYVIRGSHACRASMLMLERKEIAFRVVTLPTGAHPLLVRALGFPGHREPIRSVDGHAHGRLALLDRMGTVPALRCGSERVQTNRAIARWLDRVRPLPPLFPSDPAARVAVEEAEEWGDETFQMAARRLVLSGSSQGLDALRDRGNDGRLGPLLAKSERLRRVNSRLAAEVFKAQGADTDDRLVAELAPMLDRIDAWIADGVLDGQELNAADFLIAPSLALIAYRLDLRLQIEARPAGAWLQRVLPEPALSQR
jgi:glutathione S-transferase